MFTSDVRDKLYKELEYKLDNNLYSLYMESDNREVREKAFKTLYETVHIALIWY